MIRKACSDDIGDIIPIYSKAKEYMHTHGNPFQWNSGYPGREDIENDITNGYLYVLYDTEGIYGVFAMIPGVDKTYLKIYDGRWLDDSPYVTIHRIASSGAHPKVFSECIRFIRESYGHIRIDTHKDNAKMRQVLSQEDFVYRGVILLENGDERCAYEWSGTICGND